MSVFVDKRYEELDWISQATEPIESPLNDLLEKVPDEFIISNVSTYLSIVGDHWSLDINVSRVVSFLLLENKVCVETLSWAEKAALCKNFELEIIGSPTLNFESNTIEGGEIRLFKKTFSLDESSLKDLLGSNGMRRVRDMYTKDSGFLSRANEILTMLTGKHAEDGLRTRSVRNKKIALYRAVEHLMKENLWNIKSSCLADKIGFWISDYVMDGKLDAMANLCKLKVMTHRGLPIYSMEEV